MAHLARAKAREDLQLADSTGIVQAEESKRKEWFRERIDFQRRA
jgi:hypothetical protein